MENLNPGIGFLAFRNHIAHSVWSLYMMQLGHKVWFHHLNWYLFDVALEEQGEN